LKAPSAYTGDGGNVTLTKKTVIMSCM